MLSTIAQMVTSSLLALASATEGLAANAVKTASFERRADEWILQYNLAARELMQNGRQIISSVLAEKVAQREFELANKQAINSGDIQKLLEHKFSNNKLYAWMQGEVSRLFYDYYRFAYETARRAEYAMKQELMRPELDTQTFVKFNYWDAGRKGLLAGEALQLDLKRLEAAYHDNNQRELELTKHLSLRQLDALQLINLRDNGRCSINVPEEAYALDFPSHYFRRIKSVSVSLPCVLGPYTSVSGTLSLDSSSVQVRPGAEPLTTGPMGIKSIATSGASNDSGMFEFNFRDERYLPFEGAGAAAVWNFELPQAFRSFDYSTISDLVLHVRYTARDGGATADTAGVERVRSWLKSRQDAGPLHLLLSLRQDFPAVWATLKQGGATSTPPIELGGDLFPYFMRGKKPSYGSPVTRCLLTAPDPVKAQASVSNNQVTVQLLNAKDVGLLSDVLVVLPYGIA
jgi:hypothetical protein